MLNLAISRRGGKFEKNRDDVIGSTDLYIIFVEGRWTKSKNMGASINTVDGEMTASVKDLSTGNKLPGIGWQVLWLNEHTQYITINYSINYCIFVANIKQQQLTI